MARVLPVVLGIALIVYAFIDCFRTPANQVPPGLPKGVWLLVIALVPVLGAIAWLVVSRLPAQGNARGRRPRPVAPDDAPEFLANLDWQARKAHYERLRREREQRQAEDGDGPAVEPEQPAS